MVTFVGAWWQDTLMEPRKAPMSVYVSQAIAMALYAAVGKIAYKWLNYATGTVLRSARVASSLALAGPLFKATVQGCRSVIHRMACMITEYSSL